MASEIHVGFDSVFGAILHRFWPPILTLKSAWKAFGKRWKKGCFSSPGRDEFGLRAEWSGGVRAVRKSLLLAYQAWSRTRAQRSASQTRPSHRKRWSADSIASRIPPGLGFLEAERMV